MLAHYALHFPTLSSILLFQDTGFSYNKVPTPKPPTSYIINLCMHMIHTQGWICWGIHKLFYGQFRHLKGSYGRVQSSSHTLTINLTVYKMLRMQGTWRKGYTRKCSQVAQSKGLCLLHIIVSSKFPYTLNNAFTDHFLGTWFIFSAFIFILK